MQNPGFDTHGRVARYNIRPNTHLGDVPRADPMATPIQELYQPMQPPPAQQPFTTLNSGGTVTTNSGTFQIPSYHHHAQAAPQMSPPPTVSSGRSWIAPPAELVCTDVHTHVTDCVICKRFYVVSGFSRVPTLLAFGALACLVVALVLFIARNRILLVAPTTLGATTKTTEEPSVTVTVPASSVPSLKAFVASNRIKLLKPVVNQPLMTTTVQQQLS